VKLITTLTIFCVGTLLALGLVMLYSAGLVKTANHQGPHFLILQLVWAVAGVILAGCVVAFFDYRWLKPVSWPMLTLSVVLLASVLAGAKTNGARRWFHYGPVNFQPSELGKLAVIVWLAYYGDRFKHRMRSFWFGLAQPALVLGIVLALIFIEPDRGTTILLVTVGGMMLVLAGTRLDFIVPPLLTGGVALAYALWHDPVRHRRLLSWLDPQNHREDSGYQVWRSIVGIGSGGVEGIGLGNGREKALIPEHHTDFIFSIIGEELGLIATLATLAIFLILVLCGTQIARRAEDTFGFLLASGITFLIGLQAAINIGVVTGALPNKGLPLPFVSYGGSNLLLMLICVGLLLSVARCARQPSAEIAEPEELSEGVGAPQFSS
jgi:cell division protein FtsW